MNMRSLFTVFLLAVCLATAASATPTELLPESSYYEGRLFYDEVVDDGFLRGRIDFAVYDTELFPDEFVGTDGFPEPGEGRYIYAYQVFNDLFASEEAVNYFAVIGIDGSVVAGIGSEDDGAGGIEPSDAYVTDTEGVWEFEDGFIQLGEHSYFLVFASDFDWTVGDYEIRSPSQEDDQMPVPEIPEPSLVALLGTGVAILFGNRRTLVGGSCR
jgi:hypothetical protein